MEGLGSFARLPVAEPYPGLQRRAFDAAGATVNEYVFAAGAEFPLHRHAEEQVTLVEEGEIELRAGEETARLGPGDWCVTAPDVPHGIRALGAGARVLAVIVPRRRGAVTVLE